jgi:hypothetical protein
MKLKSKKTKTTTYTTETYELVEGINLKVNYVDGVLKTQYIPYKKIKEVEVLCYVKDIETFRKECACHHFYDTVKNNYWFKDYLVEDYLTEFNTNGFNKDNLVAISHCDHSIRDINGKCFTTLIAFDYIEGIREKDPESDYENDWDFDGVKKHLEKSEHILNLEEEEIPYYNSSFYGQKGLKFDVIMKGEWLDQLQQSDGIFHNLDKFDPLNVKQFIKN